MTPRGASASSKIASSPKRVSGSSLEIRIDLGEAVRQVVLDWQHVVADSQLRFTDNIPNRDVYISGDKTAMSRY